MAEVIVDLPAIAGEFEKGGLVRRNSTGDFKSQAITRVPHYLRASTGSCHDLCKVGSIPHVVEAKTRTPFTGRYVKTIDRTQYQSRKFMNSNSRKKKTVLKIEAPYKYEVIMEQEVPKSTRASDLKLKPVKTKVSSNKKRISESKTIREISTIRKSVLSVSPKASMKKSSMMTMRPSLSAPRQLGRKLPEIIMPKVEKNPGCLSSEIEMIKKKGDSRSQKSHITEILTKKFAECDDPLTGFPLNEENSDGLAKTKEPVISEKIFFIPEPEAENDSLSCRSPLSADRTDLIGEGTCKADSPQSTLCSIDCFDQNNHNEQEQKPRRIKRVVSEKSISSLRKVKFARGKEVNLQFDDNIPRKVKFRQGRVLENQNGKAENRGKRLRRLVMDVVTDKVKTGPVKKVALRHQEVKGRRTSSRCFNNVIEETASKLVESRKSKVQALVGAFETVFSLQDQKESKETTNAG